MRSRAAAILVADLAGRATRLAADPAAGADELERCHAQAVELVRRHGGHVAEAPEGSLLATFPGGGEALQCALALQRGTAAGSDLGWRIGVHETLAGIDAHGPAGEGLALAERLADLARPGEVVVSEPLAARARQRSPTPVEPVAVAETAPLPGETRAWRVTRG